MLIKVYSQVPITAETLPAKRLIPDVLCFSLLSFKVNQLLRCFQHFCQLVQDTGVQVWRHQYRSASQRFLEPDRMCCAWDFAQLACLPRAKTTAQPDVAGAEEVVIDRLLYLQYLPHAVHESVDTSFPGCPQSMLLLTDRCNFILPLLPLATFTNTRSLLSSLYRCGPKLGSMCSNQGQLSQLVFCQQSPSTSA